MKCIQTPIQVLDYKSTGSFLSLFFEGHITFTVTFTSFVFIRETGHWIGTPDGVGTTFALGDDVIILEMHAPDGSSTLLNFKCSEHSFLGVIVGSSLSPCLFCANGVSSKLFDLYILSNSLSISLRFSTSPLRFFNVETPFTYKFRRDFTVKPDVLFPPILQDCRQYCNVHALIAPSKLHRNLQVSTISVLTNLLISILSWQIFADKNTAKQY